ncbi:MAG: hypothetical protein FWF56_06795 [Firmicutes bacterium]|nr:hypothetical protein [Bacillota bacterium]MCL1953969.1 hypothetical protein [Bacillota bacterium]
MRTWIRVILTSHEAIVNTCAIIDRHLDDAAFAAFSQTGQQAYDNIVALLDRKHDLQCLDLLRESMLYHLDENELFAIQYIQGKLDRLAVSSAMGIKPAKLNKIVDILYSKLTKHCIELGYNFNYINKHYSKVSFLNDKYKKLSKSVA